MQKFTEYLSRFDPETATIQAGTQIERRLSQLEGCFADQYAYTSSLEQHDPIVYSVSSLEPAHGDGDLHIGIGRIMPGRVGAEYFLTRGHLHAWREASEIYIGLSGEGMMLLETESGEQRALPLTPQALVYVPGHTAHRTVNTGSEALVYLGIYPARAGHDYASIAEDNFAQVVIASKGEPIVMKRAEFLKML